MKYKGGELILLEGKEYIVIDALECNKTDYVYLLSNFKPLKIIYGIQTLNGNNQVEIEAVTNKEEKKYINDLFNNKHS